MRAVSLSIPASVCLRLREGRGSLFISTSMRWLLRQPGTMVHADGILILGGHTLTSVLLVDVSFSFMKVKSNQRIQE